MSTNLQIITDALGELGTTPASEGVSAEDGALSLRKLNQMMEAWEEDGIKLGYFAQTSTGDICPIPAWSERAVSLCLAVVLSASFSLPVSPELAANQDAAYTSLLRRLMNLKLQGVDMSHLPLGDGRLGSGYNILTG